MCAIYYAKAFTTLYLDYTCLGSYELGENKL